MPTVGGLDIHRKQITFDYLDTVTGQVQRGQVSPADREHLRAWLARFAGLEDVETRSPPRPETPCHGDQPVTAGPAGRPPQASLRRWPDDHQPRSEYVPGQLHVV
jgi:hypothetical protein